MLKHIYRAIILIAIFIASLSYFSGDIKEVVFNIDNTTTMEDATFPLVTIKSGDQIINLLHGYSSNLDANRIREAVTPLDQEKAFEIRIDSKDKDIKKLNYEIREFVGNALIESDSVSVFEKQGDLLIANIRLKAEYEQQKEYAVKITLITAVSEKMYFYHRIKIYEDAFLDEKLDFIMSFHQTLFDKEAAQDIIKYLEPSKNADNSSLAHVTINSSFDLVTWGNIQPVIITDIVPTIKEIYYDTASVELNYIAQAEINGVNETFRVTEFYRVRYAPDRMFLLNYDRRMEAFFDISLASIAKDELKLGITGDLELPFVAGADKSKLAFVRNRELWFYDLEKNEITKVFSFRQELTDYVRDIYDQHDIRILNMDAEGNIDFMVYGYMNRGQYEGRVAMLLFRFIRAESRIEELVYIPVEEPYQSLKENISELSYVNSKEVFYFHVYDSIYSFNLITKELTVVASGVFKNNIVVFKDLNYVVWQENSDPRLSEQICILDLESGNRDTIDAYSGYNILLMDMIDTNIIYGFVRESDIAQMMDGTFMAPLSVLEIATIDKKVLKSYYKSDLYVSGVSVKGNIIELQRVQKVNEGGRISYIPATNDYIMNREKEKNYFISVTDRVADQALTEYYISLPKGFDLKELPKVLTTVNTIITQDPTVRLVQERQEQLTYYPYLSGGIEGSYARAADAIAIAREGIGVVLDNENRIIWERGVKATSYTITEFEGMSLPSSSDATVESSLQLMLAYQGVKVTHEQVNTKSSSAFNILKEYSDYDPVCLTGITLDDALYYVSEGRPVLALTDMDNAVVIYGYDTFNIMVYDPKTGKKDKIGLQDSKAMFEAAGNVFISYLE